jgi:uncharacterized membrane protein YcgQ (UPF0703/DUF1980 family)
LIKTLKSTVNLFRPEYNIIICNKRQNTLDKDTYTTVKGKVISENQNQKKTRINIVKIIVPLP